MFITTTELKANLSKYLRLAEKEDVFITPYGRVVAKLSNPFRDRVETAESLFGVLPATMTFDEAMDEKGRARY